MILSDKKAKIFFPKYTYDNSAMIIRFRLKALVTADADNFGFLLNDSDIDNEIKIIKTKCTVQGIVLSANCVIKIPDCELKKLDAKNYISFCFWDSAGQKKVNFYHYKEYKLISRTISINDSACVFFVIGQSGISMTIRENRITDQPWEQIKLFVSFCLAKTFFFYKPIVLFEKEAARYEESASVVYEKLIDQGYKNVYFVLDKNYTFYDEIPKVYKHNIIVRNSIKHYLSFFAAKVFIGSELIAHAIEIRPVNMFIKRKIAREKYTLVFLQHGVMYMVSLDADQRRDLHVKRKNSKTKVVVSSQLEMEHFLDYSRYNKNDLILSGLPKFDRAIHYSDSKKIAIMPTWRPWEEERCKLNFMETTYYNCLRNIVNAVPDTLKDSIWIMPHPLIKNYIREQCGELSLYLAPEDKYDNLLKEVNLLITDYSSISYDAFYRGCNVIFWWNEKEETIPHYGRFAKLMLTEDLAFGHVCYDAIELNACISAVYGKSQENAFINNYRRIVEFNDNKNTERLINALKKEGLI